MSSLTLLTCLRLIADVGDGCQWCYQCADVFAVGVFVVVVLGAIIKSNLIFHPNRAIGSCGMRRLISDVVSSLSSSLWSLACLLLPLIHPTNQTLFCVSCFACCSGKYI